MEHVRPRQVKLLASRTARALLWPVRRFMVAEPLEALSRSLDARLEEHQRQIEACFKVAEPLEALSRSLDGRLEEQQRQIEATREEAARASGRYLEGLVGGSISELDQSAARLLNYAGCHLGFAAQRGLWVNPPISLVYEPREVRLTNVNERIVEIPYVYRALARVKEGASIVDVGAGESLVALSLASLGYEVTAVDPRPYRFEHPRLRSVTDQIEEWEPDTRFDTVVCISTIEHIGIGAYGVPPKDGRADLAAMRRMRALTKPGGLLVLTTRYGRAAVDEFQRTYDRAGIEQLLDGWEVEELILLRREGATTWSFTDEVAAEDEGEGVALVTATRA
jgi:SAM-dependent methyltransferase